MMLKILLLLSGILHIFFIQVYGNNGETPPGILHRTHTEAPPVYTAHVNAEMLAEPRQEDTGLPMLAGYSLEMNFSFFDFALQTTLNSNYSLWQLKVHAPGAKALGAVFSNLQLPENDLLYIYARGGNQPSHIISPKNNRTHGMQSSPVFDTDTLVIEYLHKSSGIQALPRFTISELIYIVNKPASGFSTRQIASSGECNVNVNCPEGDAWQKQKRGVAKILLKAGNVWRYCSGSLVNNTLQDGTPYMLTANHCGVGATEDDYLQWHFYFNNEYNDCDANTPLPPENLIVGGTLLANAHLTGGTDFLLVELDERVPDIWDPYFNGWSRVVRQPEQGVGIHHPSGDVKKISTFTEKLTSINYSGGMSNGFWRVRWAETESGHGVTEGGSSGSPIFDENGLIVGTLTGGGASCNSPTLFDYYGKFYQHWEANGDSPEKQLRYWLDPLDENPELLYGYSPNASAHLVIAEAHPEHAGIISGGGYYLIDEDVTLTAEPSPGFDFVHWTDTLGQVQSTQESFSFSMPDTPLHFIAHFEELEDMLKNLFAEERLSLYPNPAFKYITVTIERFEGEIEVQLINLLGQVILSDSNLQLFYNTPGKISLDAVPAGVYFLTLRKAQNTTTKKILIYK